MSVFVVALLFLELLFVATFNFGFCNGSTDVGCIQSERKALLSFKKDLRDPSNRLASWVGDGDCCTWAGVVCDNVTGHVLELHLQNPHVNFLINNYVIYDVSLITGEAGYEAYERSFLGGKINPSLLDLKHLIYLDLSGNNFERTKLPKFLGSMDSLRYLNLSNAGFFGIIPHQIGNLSNLQYLDLNSKYADTEGFYTEDLFWLSSLSLLEYLDLSTVDLGNASGHWLPVVNTLPSLRVLRLSGCALHHFPLLPIINISSLTSTRSRNFGLSHLTFLDLSDNYFGGRIPDQLQNLTSLRHLDLSSDGFNTSLPEWLYQLNHLEYLSLGNNRLQGVVSSTIGNLTSVRFLDLSYNKLEGKISRSFGRLCNLRSISLSSVKLNQDISKILDIFSTCISDNLESLELSDSQIAGHFPNQVGQFKNLHTLKIDHNFVSGPIPERFLGELLSLRVLDISSNKLTGVLSEIQFANVTRLTYFDASENPLALIVSIDWIPGFQLQYLNLKSCNLEHGFPFWVHTQRSLLEFLDISNSGILDNIPISSPFWNIFPRLFYLNLSSNQISGQIPNLTNASFLHVLDISSNKFSGPLPLLNSNVSMVNFSNNTFSGSISRFLCYQQYESKVTEVLRLGHNFLGEELPDCWRSWQSLVFLDLGNNNFTGTLPTSMGALIALQSLRLRKNHLFGIIPIALKNCTKLIAIDISENKFVGSIPKWIGERFSNLILLNLRSNKFHGFLPLELCSLASLQILVLADNILFGAIPRCINNISAMVTTRSPFNDIMYETNYSEPTEDALLVTKGLTMEYTTNLNLVRLIDLSKNNFSGEIPIEMTDLRALQSLNLSYNSFIGKIPENFGAMSSLESVDFSSNQFSGKIPQSISSLTFLSHLNISNNNLSGKIPLDTQLQSFDPYCFMGNELCGAPLPKSCSDTSPTSDYENGGGDGDEEHEVNWFYASMALGFVVGFWSLIGPLLVNRRWRYIYCRFLDRLGDLFGNFVNKCF